MKKIIVAIIIRFRYEHLRNESHVEFHTTVNTLFGRFGPTALGIDTLYAVYAPLLTEEIQALDIIRRSELTTEIAEQDRKRDTIYRGFADNVKSQLQHYDHTKREAARKVEVILEHYGNIAAKSLDAETAAIEDLYNELLKQGNYEQVITLGLGPWMEELIQASRRLQQLMIQRYDEAALRPDVHMQRIRKEVDSSFRSILDLLEALVRVNGPDTNKAFLTELNVVMERYKDILAQEAGRRHPVKDLSKGDNTVVEPIATQTYTEQPVTPVPVVYYREDGKETQKLSLGRDFDVAYKNNTEVGTATLTIRGKGNYKGEMTVTFNIARKV
jgi:hypothetical protein